MLLFCAVDCITIIIIHILILLNKIQVSLYDCEIVISFQVDAILSHVIFIIIAFHSMMYMYKGKKGLYVIIVFSK